MEETLLASVSIYSYSFLVGDRMRGFPESDIWRCACFSHLELFGFRSLSSELAPVSMFKHPVNGSESTPVSVSAQRAQWV